MGNGGVLSNLRIQTRGLWFPETTAVALVAPPSSCTSLNDPPIDLRCFCYCLSSSQPQQDRFLPFCSNMGRPSKQTTANRQNCLKRASRGQATKAGARAQVDANVQVGTVRMAAARAQPEAGSHARRWLAEALYRLWYQLPCQPRLYCRCPFKSDGPCSARLPACCCVGRWTTARQW